MKDEMKECFNYYASKVMDSETLEMVVSQLYNCYYKYNGWRYAEDYKEILEALNYENRELLADRVASDCDLDEATQMQILYDITMSELITENREA